ncbi:MULTISPECIES: hypothetical protein [unclassified Actinomadura]|uniref:hypothetical protein n=1 Tax=unclassified Actinomadura TaxID=2626254 RepID=UPI0011EF045C|nr:hypothetical protein [Actinomadura sp. K4S16]
MTYRAELSPQVLRQLAGMPEQVQFALAEALGVIVVDPYDPTTSEPTPNPRIRQAVFGGVGLVDYLIWDELLVVVAVDLVWGG